MDKDQIRSLEGTLVVCATMISMSLIHWAFAVAATIFGFLIIRSLALYAEKTNK